MIKQLLVQCVEDGLSTRNIASELRCSQTNVRYWLRKLGLKTAPKCRGSGCADNMQTRACALCQRQTEKRRGLCAGCRTKVRRYRVKQAAVTLLGGKCGHCGWSGNIAAFEFHHVTGDKSFAIGKMTQKSWAVVKRELAKCKLLCANCHHIEHSNNTDVLFRQIVDAYSGTTLVG